VREDAGRELGRNTSDPDEPDRDESDFEDSGCACCDRPAPGCSELDRELVADAAWLASSRTPDRDASDRDASDRELSGRDASELDDSGRSGWDRPALDGSEPDRELLADSAVVASSRDRDDSESRDREDSGTSDREVSDRDGAGRDDSGWAG